MRGHSKRVVGALGLCVASVVSSTANAQPPLPPGPAPAPAAPGAATPPAAPLPVAPTSPAEPAPASQASDFGGAAAAAPGQSPPGELPPTPLTPPSEPFSAEPSQEPEGPAKEPPAASVGGFVEAAYHGNFSGIEDQQAVPLRSYDATGSNSFLLHAAHLRIGHAFGETASGVIKLSMGSDASITNYAYAPIGTLPFDMHEVYALFSPGHFTLTVGRFVTSEGIEVIEGPLNPTVTRGFLFGLAEPFDHVGAKVAYDIAGIVQPGVGVTNGWDVLVDNNNGKTLLFSLGFTPDEHFRALASGTFGAEQAGNDADKRLSLDLTGAVIVDPLTINFQANFGRERVTTPADPTTTPPTPSSSIDASWFGFGVQPVVALGDFIGAARFEFFKDKGGTRSALTPGSDRTFMNVTLSPGYTVAEGLLLRGEFRVDTADSELLGDAAHPKKSQLTGALAASYAF